MLFRSNVGQCALSATMTVDINDCSPFIWPNPNDGVFTINVPLSDVNANRTVLIYDAKGARVFEKSFNQDIISISMKSLSSGIYFVVVKQSNGSVINKGKMVVKNH